MATNLPHPTRGHESRDINVKWIFGIVLFLFVSGMGIHGIMAWYLSSLKNGPSTTDAWRPVEPGAQKPSVHPPPPVLQVSAPLDLQAFQAREQAELHSYGWVNRTAGIVRIPIERAMDAVLQEGLPTRHGTNEGQAGPSSQQLIQRRLERREPEIRP